MAHKHEELKSYKRIQAAIFNAAQQQDSPVFDAHHCRIHGELISNGAFDMPCSQCELNNDLSAFDQH